MFVLHFITAICFATSIKVAKADLPSINNFEARNSLSVASIDTIRPLRRSLSAAVQERGADTVFKNSTSLDSSWDGAVLFSVAGGIQSTRGNVSVSAGVEIVCTTCYIKGIAAAQLTINEGFNFSQAFDNVTAEIAGEIGNFSTAVVDYVQSTINTTKTNILKDGLDLDDFDFPPIDVYFDINVPEIPECELEFQFDGMELYMQIDTILSVGATYTINLYSSVTPIGFAVGRDLLVGSVFTVDLILDVQSEIDISSGFHILLNDGLSIKIPIFSHKVSSITFNGGNFEFLPVQIQNAGVVLTAILRVGLKAGVEISTPDQIEQLSILKAAQMKVSTGLEAGVWVDIAQFKTNVTATPADNKNDCEVRVIEEYVMALGANAGATLGIGSQEWGPALETNTPVYYTTLAEACAATKRASVASTPTGSAKVINSPSIRVRDGLKTTTTVTEVTYTATQCLSTGLVNCPASLQTVSKNTVTTTLTTTVASGTKAVFTTGNTAVSAIRFGSNTYEMIATTGSPVSYVPKPTNVGGGGGEGEGVGSNIINGKTGGVSNKIIIGVSLGVGIPVLLTIVAVVVYHCRRRKIATINYSRPIYQDHQSFPGPGDHSPMEDLSRKKGVGVTVVEYQRNS